MRADRSETLPAKGLRFGIAIVGVLAVNGCASLSPSVSDVPEVAIEVELTQAEQAEPVISASVIDPGPERTQLHTVSRGETLSSIVRRYGSSITELVNLNQLEDPNALEIGQVLRVPYIRDLGDWQWPVPGGTLLSAFGTPRKTHVHKGLDIGAKHGRPVIAMRGGRVIYSGSRMRGYGKALIVDHGEGLTSLYAHNSSLLVRNGDHVTVGQQVARIGRTGNASAEHLHVEIRRNDVPVDPMLYLGTHGARR